MWMCQKPPQMSASGAAAVAISIVVGCNYHCTTRWIGFLAQHLAGNRPYTNHSLFLWYIVHRLSKMMLKWKQLHENHTIVVRVLRSYIRALTSHEDLFYVVCVICLAGTCATEVTPLAETLNYQIIPPSDSAVASNKKLTHMTYNVTNSWWADKL